MTRVALNVDLGERPNEPEALYALATVVNVACGGHAGDAASMRRAVELAARAGPAVAAHPSYPDRARFGRASVVMEAGELAASVASQCAALGRLARDAGRAVRLAKPHGALYHDASRDLAVARAVLDGLVAALDGGPLGVVGPPAGALADETRRRGLRYVREGFADRAYGRDGRLVPRGEPGALLEAPALAAAQAVRLASSGEIETICVHGDTPGAVEVARAVRAALEDAGLLDAPAAEPP
jgi:UPF0271 protein